VLKGRSTWWLFTSRLLQESVLGPVLFNTKGLAEVVEYALIKFVVHTNLHLY